MIQRIQTIYLLLVAVVCLTMLFEPIYRVELTTFGSNISCTLVLIDGKVVITPAHSGLEYLNKATKIYGILNYALLALTLVDIFLFKYRSMQLLLLKILFVCSLAYIGDIYYMIFIKLRFILTYNISTHFEAGAFIPLLSPIFLLLSGRGISNDIQKVKSTHRL